MELDFDQRPVGWKPGGAVLRGAIDDGLLYQKLAKPSTAPVCRQRQAVDEGYPIREAGVERARDAELAD